jgi:hypothetical protein
LDDAGAGPDQKEVTDGDPGAMDQGQPENRDAYGGYAAGNVM